MIEDLDHKTAILEPKIVSGWLGFPGSQLPRETTKIIGQPARPARKKGGSAKYSIMDAVLLKLGRKLAELGVSPHRVRICVENLRKTYSAVLNGSAALNVGATGAVVDIEGPFYLLARESAEGFWATVQPEDKLMLFLTQRGLVNYNRSVASREDFWQRLKNDDPEFYERLLENETEDRATFIDAGSPAIIQNVSYFVQEETRRLVSYVELVEGKDIVHREQQPRLRLKTITSHEGETGP